MLIEMMEWLEQLLFRSRADWPPIFAFERKIDRDRRRLFAIRAR